MSEYALEMLDVTKTFSKVTALNHEVYNDLLCDRMVIIMLQDKRLFKEASFFMMEPSKAA